MLPYQTIADYEHELPLFRLVDGPRTNEGRLMVRYQDRWRAVCTQQTKCVAMRRTLLAQMLAVVQLDVARLHVGVPLYGL